MDNATVKQHFGMVNIIARKYLHAIRDPSISYDDLFSEGCIGLVKALEAFDPDKGFAFSTFAYPTIAGHIKAFIDRKGHQIRFPSLTVALGNRIIRDELEGCEASEIARKLDSTVEKVNQALEYIRLRNAYSLDTPMSDPKSKSPDPETDHHHFAKVSEDLSFLDVDEFMASLPVKKQRIVELLMQGLNRREIGRELGVSHQAIWLQIEDIKRRYIQFQNGEKPKNTKRNEVISMSVQKGDIVLLDDGTRCLITDVSPSLLKAYGIKLTKENTIDKRTAVGRSGWNMTISLEKLQTESIVRSGVSLEDIDPKKAGSGSGVSSRQATSEEAKKYGIKTVLDEVEWFQDPGLTTVPTVGLNNQGLSFSEMALRDLGIKTGDFVQIGLNAEKSALVIKKDERGLKVKQNNRGGCVDNKRLVDWFDSKKVIKKRYVMQHDSTAGIHFIVIG